MQDPPAGRSGRPGGCFQSESTKGRESGGWTPPPRRAFRQLEYLTPPLHSTDERQREIADALGDLAASELKRKPIGHAGRRPEADRPLLCLSSPAEGAVAEGAVEVAGQVARPVLAAPGTSPIQDTPTRRSGTQRVTRHHQQPTCQDPPHNTAGTCKLILTGTPRARLA